MAAENYVTYVGKLLAGIRWARGPWGERLTLGFYALFADLLAEGARQANHARFTVQSHDDALGEIGNTRDVDRYFGESNDAYRARCRSAFPLHETDGTDYAVERALSEFGFTGAVVYEDWEWHRPPQPWWSQGWIFFPAGSHSVTPTTQTYGDGSTYGDGKLYGVAGITAAAVDSLRRLVKRRKRAGFIFREFIFEVTAVTYGTGALYGSGATYTAATSQAIIGAE